MNQYDVAVIGGGIAGLWICSTLQAAGFKTVVLEQAALGSKQTLASQGIIHGGSKYALTGKLTGSSEAVRAMPDRWRQHISGERLPDLSSIKINTRHQWMLDAGGVGAKASHFLASKIMSSRVQRVPSEQLLPILKDKTVHQLQEPVLDIQSVLRALSTGLEAYQAKVIDVETQSSGRSILTMKGDTQTCQLSAGMVVHSAGEGNAALQSASMQRRPLHMLMVKGKLPELWGHVIEANINPRLTITTHTASDGQTVWYIGGQLAEKGASLDGSALIATANKELSSLFPGIDWQAMAWATLKIDRAEGQQADGGRPNEPVIIEQGGQITVWPTKLVFAPLVADEVLQKIQMSGLQPSDPEVGDDRARLEFPSAVIAEYPWNLVHWV